MIIKITTISYIVGCIASLIVYKLSFKDEVSKHYNRGYEKGYADAQEIHDYFF